MDDNEKLVIALGSELNMQIEGMEERFKAILVGIESPKYLMVRMQIPSKFRNQIDKGTNFIVRYLYLGNIFGFKTKSLGSVKEPFKVTFLSYPEIVESFNIRKAQRISCFIPATMAIKQRQLKGLVTGISKNGTHFTINTDVDLMNQIKIDDPLKISFPLLGLEGIHVFEGIIKSINSDTDRLSFGIQFINVKQSIEDMIDNYVKDVLDVY